MVEMWLEPAVDQMFVAPQNSYVETYSSHPQSDAILRWGLWEVIRS